MNRFPPGVFCLHQGRCGSTVLAQLLGQHSRVQTFGEVFNHFHSADDLPATPSKLLSLKRLRASRRIAYAEAKFFDCQHLSVIERSLPELLEVLRGAGYSRVLVLNRRNYLRKLVSASVGRARGGRWHVSQGEGAPAPVRIRLDPAACTIQGLTLPMLEMFEYMEQQYETLREEISGSDHLWLEFEDHIEPSPLIAYEVVCEWLQLVPEDVQVGLRRTSPTQPSDVVSNWTEVGELLSGSRWEWMLNET